MNCYLRISTFVSLVVGSFGSAAFADVPGLPAPVTLAQAAPSAPLLPSLYPTDITPVGINREQELFAPSSQYYIFKKLPSRLWFNLSAETSQRYESNVFFTKNHGKSDYVYRILPNISLGYNIAPHTSVYTNYFVIKDLFADHTRLSFPTTQSIALGLRHEILMGPRTTLQFDFQARELFQTTHIHQADLIPGFTLTRVLNQNTVLFTNILLQMRGKNYFVAPTREIDPFYTAGVMKSYGSWVFSVVGTLVTNFRHPPFNDSIPRFSNNSIIADFEVSHPVSKKIPNLVAFIRAEPIWNWSDHGLPGISGYDFRLFSGLRMTLAKPSYYSQMEKLRQQLKEITPLPNKNKGGQSNSTPGASGPSSYNILPAIPLDPKPEDLVSLDSAAVPASNQTAALPAVETMIPDNSTILSGYGKGSLSSDNQKSIVNKTAENPDASVLR